MANDESRAQALLAIAEKLGGEDAHQIRKYVQLVGERDAGPSAALKEENTKLVARNQELEAAISMLQTKTADYGVMRESAIRNQRANDGLRESNTQLTKRNAELVKKHDEMVDMFAKADMRANAAEKALRETVEAQAIKTEVVRGVEIVEPNVPEDAR